MKTRRPGAIRWARRLLLIVAAAAGAILLACNVSWWQSDQSFVADLERSLRIGTDWMVAHPETENAALLYMLADMAAASGDARLHQVVAKAMASPAFPLGSVWRRLFQPDAPARHTRSDELGALQDYQRWFVYAVAPSQVELTEDDRAAMFDRDRYMWGSRMHQLFALILYKNRTGNTPALTELMNHLCERIAREEYWDIRVTDLYLQRIAFILAAGRSDLIRRRWVERAIASQHADGGWISSWYGWGPSLFVFSARPKVPNSHTTVQGMWSLYMLKYRYPEWLRQHAASAFQNR